ncbi:hypothetical protein I0E98_14885 [Pseudomonas lalucatii]|nr:hypothetical protein [Pseudomonas lalucatii]
MIDYDRLYAQVERVAGELDLAIHLERLEGTAASLVKGRAADGTPTVALQVQLAGAQWQLEARAAQARPAPALVATGRLGPGPGGECTDRPEPARPAPPGQPAAGPQPESAAVSPGLRPGPQGLALLDAEARLLSVNRSLCRLLQREPRSLLGHRLAQFGDNRLHSLQEQLLAAPAPARYAAASCACSTPRAKPSMSS